jgi:ABC-type molybdate transport system ATPase subunit
VLRQASSQVPGPTIYVTHHVDDAIELAEHVMTLDAGRLAASARPWEEA